MAKPVAGFPILQNDRVREILSKPGADVINKFSIAILPWNKQLWLDVASHATTKF